MSENIFLSHVILSLNNDPQKKKNFLLLLKKDIKIVSDNLLCLFLLHFWYNFMKLINKEKLFYWGKFFYFVCLSHYASVLWTCSTKIWFYATIFRYFSQFWSSNIKVLPFQHKSLKFQASVNFNNFIGFSSPIKIEKNLEIAVKLHKNW